MNRLIKIISDVLFFTGLAVAGLFLVGHFTGRVPFSAFIVSSGSMEPAIHTGSVVVVAPEKSYKPGDVVTFYTGTDKKATTTHRLIATNGQVFKVAGDANNQPDAGLVDTKNIIGTVRFSVPYLGYLAAFAKTPQGFILLVIVPATIIIYEELKTLFFELGKFKNTLGKKIKLVPSLRLREGQGELHINPAIIILPIFFALLIPLTLSISYFIDRETSSGNSITITEGDQLKSLSIQGPVLDTTVVDATDSGSPPATGSAELATSAAEITP